MVTATKPHGEPGTATERKHSSKTKSHQLRCGVSCLDGSELSLFVDKQCKGEVLFNKVTKTLNIIEKEYVGLLYTNTAGVKMWLDIHKDLSYQLGDSVPNFKFRVKFYEPEPARLQDEHMRYLLYLQLREDIVAGRLICSDAVYAVLGSYTAQAELGDFNLSEHEDDYLDDYDFAPNQNADLIEAVKEFHKERRGQSSAQAELNFLDVAKKIPRYGVDMHLARDNERAVEIGVGALGVIIYINGKREYLFRWQIQDAILHSRRKFTVKLKKAEGIQDELQQKRKPQTTFVYYFDTAKLCKQCYKSCVEYHAFFRLARPDAPRKKADSVKLGSSFRYSDRTLYQLRHQPSTLSDGVDNAASFQRTLSKRNKPSGSGKRKSDEKEGQYDISGILPVSNKKIKTNEVDDALGKSKVQVEEVEVEACDESLYDSEEWEIAEKTLADGSKKRVRRRIVLQRVLNVNPEFYKDSVEEEDILEQKPLQETTQKTESNVLNNELKVDENNPFDERFDLKVEKALPDGTKKQVLWELPADKLYLVPAMETKENESPVIYEFKPVGESEVDDYDGREWETLEACQPDGTSKPIFRRVILQKIIYKPSAEGVVESPVQYEEEEFEADEATDAYDPREWEEIEKYNRDGSKKKVLRRIILTRLSPSDVERSDKKQAPLPVQVEEIDYDSMPTKEIDLREWQVIDKTEADGSSRKVCRRLVITKVVYKPTDKKSEPPIFYEEKEVDPDSPDDENFDSKVWEKLEDPNKDTRKNQIRRRIILNQIDPPLTRKENIIEEVPFEFQEVELHENNPEDAKYDLKEWEVLEKIEENGKKKRFRRKIVVQKIIYKPDDQVEETETPVFYKEIPLDESHSGEFDPKVWQIIEKTELDGKKKKWLKRKVLVTKTILNPSEQNKLDEQPLITCEEIPVDKSPLEDEKFDHQDWELDTTKNVDGTIVPVRRRVVIKKMVYKPALGEDLYPPIQYEEKEWDSSIDLAQLVYNPKDYEIVEKDEPAGKVKRLLRRVVLTRLHTRDIETKDGSFLRTLPLQYEEVDYDPTEPKYDIYDPQEWEIFMKTEADGSRKNVRRRLVVTKVVYKSTGNKDQPPISYEDHEVDPNNPEDDKYDPKVWVKLSITEPDGKTRLIRRKVTIKHVGVNPCSLDAIDETPVECSEVDVDESNQFDEKFNSKDWEVVKKILPNGHEKRVFRRIFLTRVHQPEDQPVQYQDISQDRCKPDYFDPEEWHTFKFLKADNTEKVRQRRIIIKKLVYKRLPSDNKLSPVQYEEIDREGSDNQVHDLNDWEVILKHLDDGNTKEILRRPIITRLSQEDFRTRDGKDQIKVIPVHYEDVEYDPGNPQNEKYNPKLTFVKRNDHATFCKHQPLLGSLACLKFGKEIFTSKVCDRHDRAPRYEKLEYRCSFEKMVVYKPMEWELTKVPLTDGKEKLIRRRIVVRKVVYKPTEETGVTPIRYDEYDINSPEVSQLDPETWEDLSFTSDGKRKHVKRRLIVTKINPADTTKPKEEDPIEEHLQYEEVPIDQNANSHEDFDPEEWEIIEKEQPDGTKKQVKRRVISTKLMQIKPKYSFRLPTEMTHRAEEDPFNGEKFEEMEVDEENPDDEKFNSEEWETYTKTLPDGTTKRFRRRVLITVITTTQKIIVHPDGHEEIIEESDPVETIEELAEGPPLEYEEVPVNENSLEDDRYNSKEWEVVSKILSDGTQQLIRRRIKPRVITTTLNVAVRPGGREEVIVDDNPSSPVIERNVLDSSIDNLLSDINTLSKSLDEQDLELNEDDTRLEQLRQKEEESRCRKSLQQREVSIEENSAEIKKQDVSKNETEARKEVRLEDEIKLREDHNATITSIFVLPDEDLLGERISPVHNISDFPEIDPTKISSSQTSTLSREEKKTPKPDPTKIRSTGDEANNYKPNIIIEPSYCHSYTSDISKVDQSPTVDETKPCTISETGLEQEDYHLPDREGPHSEIIYTVKDVSSVEQGQGGFVRAVRAKHEDIAHEKNETHRNSKRISVREENIPKGYIPTLTVSLNEHDDKLTISHTKTPPAVPVKPAIIAPAASDTQMEDPVFHIKQVPVESLPVTEPEAVNEVEVPEVETKVNLFEEASIEHDLIIASDDNTPGEINTKTVQMIPQVESQVVETETIQSMQPEVEMRQTGNCFVRTEVLPTEVITKTITVEGDSSSLTPEELKNLLEKTGSDEGDNDVSTVTQVLHTTTVQTVITGQTIIVEGDSNEEEIEKMVKEAVEKSNNELPEDGSIVFTAVQKLDEGGNVIE